MSRNRLEIAGALGLFALTGCGESCAPGQVADGVGRLTIRNVGAILQLINDDTTCGFSSAKVKARPTVMGAAGTHGSVTWVVDGCVLDMKEKTLVSESCSGVATTARGRVEVTATRTVEGLLTGDPENPVIPGGADAVMIAVDRATLQSFLVEVAGDTNKLEMINGSIAFDAQPRLAASKSTGACSVPTKNILFSNVVYQGAMVHVTTEDRSFDVPVPSSALNAVVGQHSGFENTILGKITVWDEAVMLTDKPADAKLDPDYDAARYEESYACTNDMASPVSYECEGIGGKIAQGASRLTVRSFAAMGTLLDNDTTCGFASAAAFQRAEVLGEVGTIGAVTLKAEGCVLSYPAPVSAGVTCGGVHTMASGKVTVSGTKTLRGRITGDPTTPVVPMDNMPATVVVTQAAFDNFRVEKEGTALTWKKGSITGSVSPETVLQASTGACGFKSQNARFENLSYKDAEMAIESSSGKLGVRVKGSSLYAVNGVIGAETNVLRGTIQVAEETHAIPVDASDAGLEPEFDLAKYEASWQCGDLVKPVSRQCVFVAPIVQGAAQLTANTFGAALKLAEADPRCGFNSPAAAMTAQAAGNLGEDGSSVTVTIGTPCTMSFPEPTEIAKDCNGVSTMVQGTVAIVGTKKLKGFLSGDPAQPIVPTSRDPAELDIMVIMNHFAVWTTPLTSKLTVLNGQLSGKAVPRTALDRTTGACSIPTPIAAFSGLRWSNSSVEVFSQNKTFRAQLATSALEAVNGSRDGVTNRLSGKITVDGAEFPIPLYGPAVLNPAYDQAAFDASWACIPNMVPAANDEMCSLRPTLAEGAARLLVMGLGAMTKWVNEDDDCGFQANLTNPSRVTGDPGEMGEMEWRIQRCRLQRAANANAYGEDCLHRRQMMSGEATYTGARTVQGRREEIGFLFLTFDSIAPNTRTSVHVGLDSITPNQFTYYELDPGQTAPKKKVTLHGGVLTARADPVTGENRRNAGVYDIGTPISHFTNVRASNVPMTIVNDGKTFKLTVQDAELEAFNGSFGGRENMIQGRLVIDGKPYPIAPGPLNPEYSQADFDARYACTENLRAVVPAR